VNKDLKELIREYLKEAKLMQLATSLDGQPWVCSVWFVADNDLNIYWFSSTARRHSEEVLKNPKVAGAIVLPHTPDDPPRGIQFSGEATVLEDEAEIEKVISYYSGRIFTDEKIKEFMDDKDNPHKFYKIKPTQFVLFDVVNFPENSRQELNF
jgi:uncharacterized protein YhbP (UPF0306 family)